MPNNRFLISHFSFLINKKNLLAFSAGIDSTALFFLLIENHIKVDIAIVDYGLREQSKKEIAYAKSLAERYNLKCYIKQAPRFITAFEKQARDFRYRFFEDLMGEHGYDNLLTAHQLNDQLEWLLMRLSKGAGLSELMGLEPISQRDGYTLIRPLLGYSKEELLEYLEKNNYTYFVDQSNSDETYERNRFRKQFSDPLMRQFKDGIKNSFNYLRNDKEQLERGFKLIISREELRIVKLYHPSSKARAADLTLKRLGYLLSAPQRKEIEKEDSLVVGGAWAVEQQDDLLYIAPFIKTDMPKTFKEQCRVSKIPAKIRPYLWAKGIDVDTLP